MLKCCVTIVIMAPPSRQSRHLWVGNLPEDIDKDRITDYFSRFGKVEGVHILPQRYPGQGIAAFVDFYDVHAAVDAVQTAHTISGREIRVNYKFKDGGGPRFGRHEQSPSRHEKERYGDKKTQRRSRSKSASSTSSSSSSTSAASKSKDGSRPSSTRSRSSSSSSSSSSDTTRDDDKKKRKKSRSRSRSASPPRLGLFVKVSNLSSRPSDNTLREDLYFELRKHCDLHTVRIYRDNDERYAVVKFRNVGDSQKMYSECNEMTFMGHKIKLSPWHPERRRSFYDNYPPGERHYGNPFSGHPSHMHHYGGGQPDDSLEPDTTRTLFVGNIPRGISVYELRDYFIRFGHILDVEIKKMSGQATYGFVLFFDLMSACAAKRFMDGALIGRNTIKVGFGKGTPSKSLWVDGVDPTMSDAQVEKHFSNYGTLINIGFDRQRCTVVVVYTNVETAKEAMLDLRGTIIGKTRVRVLVDFCSKEARAAFFQALEHGDLDGPDFPPGFDPWVPSGPGRGGFHPHGGGRQFFRGGPHQMDYGYQPFMEGRGGGYPMDRMAQRGHHDPDYDDYGEQLRAYSAKKEREKDYRQRRHRHRSSSSESGGRSRSSSEEGERSSKKGKKKRTTKVDNDKEAESDVEERNKSGGKKKKSKEESADSDSDTDREVATKKTKVKKKEVTPPSDDDDKESDKDENLAKDNNKDGNNDDDDDTTKKQILKFKVAKKPRIEPSAMLSSGSDEETKVKEDMAALSRKKLLAREAEKQNGAQPKETDQVIPKDEDISGGDLSDMEEDDVNVSKKTEPTKRNTDDVSSDKMGKSLKDKKLRSYRGKAGDGEGADSDEAPNLKKDDVKNNKKSKSGTKELPLRYREEDDSSVKRGRHSDRPTSPSSPPPVFDRHQQKRYGSSPRRYGRRRSQGSSSPQHHRYRQQDTLSKPYRGGHSYTSWRRSKSPRQRGHWGSPSPNRAHSPSDKRHQTDDDQGSWKGSRYASQRSRPDKRKAAGDQDGYDGKRRRTETGGPRSPSATPPPPPDMEEPRPQQPSEPPPTQPDPPLPSEGSFMPSCKEPAREVVTAPAVPSTASQQVYTSQPPQQQIAQQPGADTLVELLRRYPVMWQGHFTLKNDNAAVQLHFLSGNMELAKKSLPFPTPEKPTPSLRIAQRMRLEATQIEGVEKRIQMAAEHCLLLALPCGRDPLDVHAQTRALKTSFISYLMQKQAAGIINVTGVQVCTSR